jgi:branched-chain amino acid aminotransferase
MLNWPAGPKAYDGVWAPWWYQQTHKSSGFQQPASKQQQGEQQQPQQQQGAQQPPPKQLPDHLKPLLEECRPLYALLRRHALKPLCDAATAVPRPLGSGEADSSGHGGKPGQAAAAGGGASSGAGGEKQHSGTHAYLDDPRNADILVGMRDGVTGGQLKVEHSISKAARTQRDNLQEKQSRSHCIDLELKQQQQALAVPAGKATKLPPC